MEKLGRDTERALKAGLQALPALVDVLGRHADVMEKVVTLATEEQTIEFQSGPPLCPHCGFLNPRVSISAEGGRGPLVEFVIDAQCMECGKTFFAIPEGFSMHTGRETALEELKERKEAFKDE